MSGCLLLHLWNPRNVTMTPDLRQVITEDLAHIRQQQLNSLSFKDRGSQLHSFKCQSRGSRSEFQPRSSIFQGLHSLDWPFDSISGQTTSYQSCRCDEQLQAVPKSRRQTHFPRFSLFCVLGGLLSEL